MEESWRRLFLAALAVRENAYAEYSSFRVGAAIEGEDGEVFVGCNVENLSLGLTMCAERVALGRAVSDGVRRFKRVLVVADTRRPLSPCGACRQVLAEFQPELWIRCATVKGEFEDFRLAELLPRPRIGILDREAE